MKINMGDKISTPRYGTVTVETSFSNWIEAQASGYCFDTLYRGESYVYGKSLSGDHMVFAVAPPPPSIR